MELILGSPFPFLKLPVEIRIGIYKYAAAFDDMPRKLKVKSAVELQTPTAHAYFGDPRAYMSDLRNQQSIAQPDLFHACSQIYHEKPSLLLPPSRLQVYNVARKPSRDEPPDNEAALYVSREVVPVGRRYRSGHAAANPDSGVQHDMR